MFFIWISKFYSIGKKQVVALGRFPKALGHRCNFFCIIIFFFCNLIAEFLFEFITVSKVTICCYCDALSCLLFLDVDNIFQWYSWDFWWRRGATWDLEKVFVGLSICFCRGYGVVDWRNLWSASSLKVYQN